MLISHTLTGYQKGDAALSLEYSLHVVNQGDNAITELSLSLVPLPPVFGNRPTVRVAYLGPHEETDVKVVVQVRPSLDQKTSAAAPLFWAGKYVDAEGKIVELPFQSRPRGAK